MITSVALCTYNGEKYLREQLDSILKQSQPVDEIIICDDASTDGTKDILNSYQKNNPDLIKVFLNESSLGTIKNFEKAISLTNGDITFLSDQDDIWIQNKVVRISEFFIRNKDCKLYFTNGFLVDEYGEDLKTTLWDKWQFNTKIQKTWKQNTKAFKDLIHNNNKITGATVCLHKDLKKFGLPINVPYGYWHDAWFGIHAAAVDGLFFTEECLIKYRIHPNQQVGISNNPKISTLKANKSYLEKEEFLKQLWQLYPKKMNKINKRKDKKGENFINKLFRKFGSKES